MSRCRKVRYSTAAKASAALAIIKLRDDKRRKQECRYYPCPSCKGWHLTSMPLNKPEEARP